MDCGMIREKNKLCNLCIELYLCSTHNTPLFFTQAVVISSDIIVISCLAVIFPNA